MPVESLMSFLDDPNPIKRRSIANNRKAPADALVKLSRDGEAQVRRWVALHPNTPEEVIRSMLADSDLNTTMNAKDTLKKRKKSVSESRLRRLIRQML